ncbi:tetratricopeptide repeat protein [Pseudoalteromonas haloplanktis]|uniref:Tetratricopeptide repeat protein n=1 Tax=Pseudoalteromonas haloplanktis TaxID=228 RepID=A0ABU1BBG9_PSEHA|nr:MULTISPECIES: tetratricopeptide repeat protein [Pseudoalteromonas]MDQ9091706.1 tetratricopeptide repeat protein [Pseudoalteromonas haloplanktis]TMN73226.1 sel1 repeat family protein [Pseudoalteromonas sp. S1727]
MWQPKLNILLMVGALSISGIAHAGLEEGILAANEGQFEEALKEFRYLADKGYAPGIYELGQLYEGGFGVTRDYHKAAELYQQGVKKQHVDSMFALAVLYQEGKGVKLDKQMSVKLFKQAAEKNMPAAQFNLGVMYANGDGVAQDYKEAMRWYEKAAGNNYTLAQFNMALMYFEGHGVEKNIEKSYIWNTVAEYNGNLDASHSRKLDERKLMPAQITAAKEKADVLYEKILAGLYAGEGRMF